MDAIVGEYQPCISVITEIELMCWKGADNNDQILLQSFIEEIVVVDLEQDLKLKTAEIRRTTRIKLPNAIIAATALVNGITVLTRNSKNFVNIKKLEIVNPFDEIR